MTCRVLEIVAGPDAGRCVALDTGRHILGRAPGCRLALDDPAVESHHVVVSVTPDGAVRFDQIAGRHPVRVDGMPVGEGVQVDPGAAIEVGDSLLAVGDDRRTRLEIRSPGARFGHGRVVLGADTVRLPIERCEVHHRHPVLADLARTERDVVGLVVDAGNPAAGAARAGVLASVVCQLSAHPATAGWRIVTVGASALSADDGGDRVIVVTDRAAPLRPGALVDRIVASGSPVTVLLLVDAASPATRQCSAMLHLGGRWRARWIADTAAPMEVVRLHARGVRGNRLHPTAAA